MNVHCIISTAQTDDIGLTCRTFSLEINTLSTDTFSEIPHFPVKCLNGISKKLYFPVNWPNNR